MTRAVAAPATVLVVAPLIAVNVCLLVLTVVVVLIAVTRSLLLLLRLCLFVWR